MNPLVFYLIYLASLLVPAVYAFAIRNRVLPVNRPVLYYIWALLLIEITQSFTDFDSTMRLVSENLQYLVEFLMVIWILAIWITFEGLKRIVPVIIILAIAAWTMEKIWLGWDARISWIRISFCFLLAIVSVFRLSRTLIGRSGRLARNPIFLFCLAFVVNYTLYTIFQLVVYTGGLSTESMAEQLFYFSVTVGTIINIIYLSALLCISTRASFSFR